jgi:MGT family glycosyltransferase
VPGSPDDLLPGWADRLGARPVIYLSLGTVPIFNQPAMFAPILDALGSMDVDVICTVGRDNDPAAFGSLPSTVHLEHWLSLAAVLPRCDAVVCHSGAGTTLAALTHGRPLVLVPRGADQFPTAVACQRVGAAEVVMPDRVGADALGAAVRAVLGDGSFRAAAMRLADEIATRLTAESVAEDLEVVFSTDTRLGR